MYLFILDAEVSDIRKLKQMTPWEQLGFSLIQSAYSVEKARQLFQKRIQMKRNVEMEIQGGEYWKENQTLIQQMF